MEKHYRVELAELGMDWTWRMREREVPQTTLRFLA